MRRGIVLAGGSGTRLAPATIAISKHLIPIYDKPMIYYPLSVLMLAGIRDILIITTAEDQRAFQTLLGDGSAWGVRFKYEVQPSPDGLAQAFIIGEEFLDGNPSVMVLGDNIFYGDGLQSLLSRAHARSDGATVFGYHVSDPERYGVVEFDRDGRVLSIEEKPPLARSNFAITGLYFYDSDAPSIARSIKPSQRNELEITSMNQIYLETGTLNVEMMGRGYAWLDTGTFDSLLEANEFVRTVQRRQGLSICCPEEIGLKLGYIDPKEMAAFCASRLKNPYYAYIHGLALEVLNGAQAT